MSTNALRNKILSIFVIISFILSSNLGYADALRAPLGREAQRLKQALLEKLEERIKTAKLVIIDFDKVLTLDKKLIPTLDIVQSLLQADESLKICLISSGNDIPIRELLSLWPIRYAKLVDFLESGRFILRKDITGDKKDAVVDVAKKTKIAETATVIISESKQMEQALGNSLFIAVDDTDNYNMLSTDGVLRHMLNTKNPAYLKFDIDLAGIMRAPVIDFTGLTELVDDNDFLITSIRASYYRELIRLGVPQERAMQIAKGIIRSRLNEDREMMAVAGLLKGRAGLCMKIGGTSFKSGIVDENGALSSIGESKFWEKIAGIHKTVN